MLSILTQSHNTCVSVVSTKMGYTAAALTLDPHRKREYLDPTTSVSIRPDAYLAKV